MKRIAMILIAFAASGLSACSRGTDSTARTLLQKEAAFSTAIAVQMPGDDTRLYNEIITGQRQSDFLCCGCNGKATGQIADFNGQIKDEADRSRTVGAGEVLYRNNLATVKSVHFWEHTGCSIFTDTLASAIQSATQRLSKENVTVPQASDAKGALLPIAYRSDIRITYSKKYKTEVPMGGETDVIAAKCEYTLVFVVDGLNADQPGTCEAKWFRNNDTGEWSIMALELHDPDILIGPQRQLPQTAASAPANQVQSPASASTSLTKTACGYGLGAALFDKWRRAQQSSTINCPIESERDAPPSPKGTRGRWAEFAGGDGNYIVLHTSGPHAGSTYLVQGCIFMLYKQLGGTGGVLGFPVSDEYDVPDGRRSDFEGGNIQWAAATRRCVPHVE